MSRMKYDLVSGSMNVRSSTGRKTHHLEKKREKRTGNNQREGAEQQMA